MLHLPTRPPSFLLASLTAVAMGQYWKILDIDRREILPNGNGLKLWQIVNSNTTQQLVHLLARPTFLQQEVADGTRSLTVRAGPTSNVGRFRQLPNEILITITGFLVDLDAILLGLTCKAMWLSMHARLQEALVTDAAPWSGHRIITLGDYADVHPPNMLTGAEETELRQFYFENKRDDDDENDEGQSLELGALYDYVSEKYAEAKRGLLRLAVEAFLDPTEAALLRTLVRPLYNFIDDEDGYVLRNLSQHEYVRGNALVELCGGKDKSSQPFVEPIGFGQLIALRTQWTDDPSGTIGPLKGDWAGDRLDIVLTKTLQREGRGEVWRDVSKDAVSMLNETMLDKLRGW